MAGYKGIPRWTSYDPRCDEVLFKPSQQLHVSVNVEGEATQIGDTFLVVSSSARNWTPYRCEMATAISRASMESSPSPSPNRERREQSRPVNVGQIKDLNDHGSEFSFVVVCTVTLVSIGRLALPIGSMPI